MTRLAVAIALLLAGFAAGVAVVLVVLDRELGGDGLPSIDVDEPGGGWGLPVFDNSDLLDARRFGL